MALAKSGRRVVGSRCFSHFRKGDNGMIAHAQQGGYCERWLTQMRVPRLIFSWYLRIVAALFLGLLGRVLFLEAFQLSRRVLEGIVLVTLMIIFGIAGWVARRESESAKVKGRFWTILASLLSLCLSLGIPLLISLEAGWGFWYLQIAFGLPTLIGIVGLIAFLTPGGTVTRFTDRMIDSLSVKWKAKSPESTG